VGAEGSTSPHEGGEADVSEEREANVCLACDRGSEATPLIRLEYRGTAFWICPQHLPILIHDPARLVGRLPGAEGLEPSEHQD
jgi:hypothetical protein